MKITLRTPIHPQLFMQHLIIPQMDRPESGVMELKDNNPTVFPERGWD